MNKRHIIWSVAVLSVLMLVGYGLWAYAAMKAENLLRQAFSPVGPAVSYDISRFGYPFTVGLQVDNYHYQHPETGVSAKIDGPLLLSSSFFDALRGRQVVETHGEALHVHLSNGQNHQARLDVGTLALMMDVTSGQAAAISLTDVDVYEAENRLMSVDNISVRLYERPGTSATVFDAGVWFDISGATFIDQALAESISLDHVRADLSYQNFPADSDLEQLMRNGQQQGVIQGADLKRAAIDFIQQMEKHNTQIALHELILKSPDFNAQAAASLAIETGGVPAARVDVSARAEQTLLEKLDDTTAAELKNTPAGRQLLDGEREIALSAEVKDGLVLLGGFPLTQAPSLVDLLEVMPFPAQVYLNGGELITPEVPEAPADLIGALEAEQRLIEQRDGLLELQAEVAAVSATLAVSPSTGDR